MSSSQSITDEKRINELIKNMSLEEKIGQTWLLGTSSRDKGLPEEIKELVRKGKLGAMLNLTDEAQVAEIQKIAVEESPNHIPLIFGRDVIHGYKTIFPIPLGLACSWDMNLVEQTAQVAANEAYSKGINWTFAPMVDICRDARWGRIAESPGEDPLLASRLAAAYINGFQGKDLSKPGQILACAKHFAAYGAAEGGRDYNTVNLPEQILRNIYLRPFEASAKAGVATFMTSFNDINGIPASANHFLLQTMLRKEWKYDGFVVSDWNSITEMLAHGYCTDEKDAAFKAASVGLDMEMTSPSYANNLKKLIVENQISEKTLDDMVRNILRIKFRMGLFDNPYFKDKDKFKLLDAKSLDLAKTAAIKSCVLLKNEKRILPLAQKSKLAIIGPLADAAKEQLGTWIFDGNKQDSKTPLSAFKDVLGAENTNYAPGLSYSRSESEAGFADALAAANKADVIIFFGGEEAILSGEAHSRADIRLPGKQEQLLEQLSKTGKPIVLVILAGRPITLENVLSKVSAVVMAWHPGTMAGPALVDLVLGKVNFSGRLTVTWPKMVGQIPIYYNHTNTGRPADSAKFVGIKDIPIEAWQSSLGNESHYLDAGFLPQYPFGYGLSYATFSYSNLLIEKTILNGSDSLVVSATITNTGTTYGVETAQLYVRDLVGSLVRPMKELKDYRQIGLRPNESKLVKFKVPVSELGFYNDKLVYTTESGEFSFWIGPNSASGLKGNFNVK